MRHLLIWMTTVRRPTTCRCSCISTLKYTFICVYWWTRQRIHNTLVVVDRYLRLMGDKTIPDEEPRLESFYPPFVAGIDLPHQGVVDSYSLICSPGNPFIPCEFVCYVMTHNIQPVIALFENLFYTSGCYDGMCFDIFMKWNICPFFLMKGFFFH